MFSCIALEVTSNAILVPGFTLHLFPEYEDIYVICAKRLLLPRTTSHALIMSSSTYVMGAAAGP